MDFLCEIDNLTLKLLISSKYKFRDQDQLYFVSFAVIYWIDLFIREEYKTIMLDSWRYCIDQKGMELYGWCLMTSHVHTIIGSHGEKLEKIMQSMKKHTSERLKAAIRDHPRESRREWMLNLMTGRKNSHNREFQLWQQDNHPVELTTLKIAHQRLDYAHDNPVIAGIVEKPEDYLYSSARNYFGLKGLIDIILLDPVLV